jgi:hypothetical protein
MSTYARYGSGTQYNNIGDGTQYIGSGQHFIGTNHIGTDGGDFNSIHHPDDLFAPAIYFRAKEIVAHPYPSPVPPQPQSLIANVADRVTSTGSSNNREALPDGYDDIMGQIEINVVI